MDPATKETDLIFDVTTDRFEDQVLDRSMEVPVVVDFWATWCGPCRMLGPVLEKAVAQLGGKVLLAKVDTDREPELAQRYQIRGIPAVKAFHNGQVVDEFTGARDPKFVRSFLEGLAPSPQMQAVKQALDKLQQGQGAAAEALLRPLLAAGPGAPPVPPVALLLLAEAVLRQGRFDEVGPLLDQLDPRSPEADQGEQIKKRLGFYRAAQEVGGEARAVELLKEQPDNPDARYALAAALTLRGDHRGALEQLLALLQKDRRYRDDGARQAMLIIFDQLGRDHELTDEYRRKLQVLL